MKRLSSIILLLIIVKMVFAMPQKPVEFDIRIDQKVNFLHFIDHLSQWSPYTGNDALDLYNKEFSMTMEDSIMLNLYSSNRLILGWESEIKLFNWAYRDYDFSMIPDSMKPEYQTIKQVIDYFSQKKNDHTNLYHLLEIRFDHLWSRKEDILSYAEELQNTFNTIEPYLNIWNKEADFSLYPIYICYAHKENSSHGGANGQGVYSEFDFSANKNAIESGFGIITHEITHKVTSIGENILNFIQNDSLYTESAVLFLKKHHLSSYQLDSLFKSKDPQGYGNPEYQVFEEVYVYYISPVLIHHFDNEMIANKAAFYKAKGQEELARTWYGISLFKTEIEKQDIKTMNKDVLIWKLIEIFYEHIYFPNHKFK